MFLTGMPYTNYQNLNLDWMLKTMRELPDTINTAIENAMQHVVFWHHTTPKRKL